MHLYLSRILRFSFVWEASEQKNSYCHYNDILFICLFICDFFKKLSIPKSI
jgi:hypothetical protein